MFDPIDGLRVFTVRAGADFAATLMDGLATRMQSMDPFARAGVAIRLNTRRAQRVLEERMARDARFAGPMPQIGGAEALLNLPDLPHAVDPLRRKLHVARLIGGLIAQEPSLAPRGALFDLAERLLDLLDTLQAQGVSPDRLDLLNLDDVSAHWQISARFMRLMWTLWPQILNEAEPGHADPEVARMAQIAALEEAWATQPPAHPLILAGSTGSRPWMRRLMCAVARLPQGAVILPGYDADLPEDLWQKTDPPALPPDHPQSGLALAGHALGVDLSTLPQWFDGGSSDARSRLISLALRPAPVTDSWLAEAPERSVEVQQATTGISLIEAPAEREEATAIACAMRDAVEQGKSVALITPDRDLSRRVSAALDRWRLIPDDSAGRPLHLTPPGVMLRMLLNMVGTVPQPAALIALLKHPLVGGASEARRLHLRRVIGLQTGRDVLATPEADWQRIIGWAEDRRNDDDATTWARWLQDCFAPLSALSDTDTPEHILTTLRMVADRLSRGVADDVPEIWREEAGLAAVTLLDRLQGAVDAMAGLAMADTVRLVEDELIAAQVRSAAFLPHPDVLILGALEARMTRADITILGGLNEGVWPERPSPDPWLSRKMRSDLGLPMPERDTGLAAHDFQNAINAPEVIITRAARAGGAPTVASRWVIRLTNLIAGLGDDGKAALETMSHRGDRFLDIARALEKPVAAIRPAPRPMPAPPVAARPHELPVTGVEVLIRDPYATYARYVLGLRALDLPGREADDRERGNVLHKVMERFAPDLNGAQGAAAHALFAQTATEVLEKLVPWPATRALWHARLMRVAPVLVEREIARQVDARPAKTEVKGRRQLPAPPFTLTAKADRIDLAQDGTLRIYDYKSGSPPSPKQIRTYALQLPLQAEIARAGGFEDIDAADVSRLEYIGMGAGARVQPVDEDQDATRNAWDRFAELIAAYENTQRGYPARQQPALLSYASDYDHLSRLGEWDDGDDAALQEVGQ